MLWEYINTSLDHRGSIIKMYKTINNTDVLNKEKVHLGNNKTLIYSVDAQTANIQYFNAVGHSVC